MNSSACEQVNSWIRSYTHILSNMNAARFGITLLLLFHLRNCYHTRICCRTIDAKRVLVSVSVFLINMLFSLPLCSQMETDRRIKNSAPDKKDGKTVTSRSPSSGNPATKRPNDEDAFTIATEYLFMDRNFS